MMKLHKILKSTLVCYCVCSVLLYGQVNAPMDKLVWDKCWNETQGWFDFTKKVWTELPTAQERDYAKAYQHWYAQQKNLLVEKTFTGGKASFAMVLIPPGKFLMGELPNKSCREYDETRHPVVISKPFWIGKYEVTQAQWCAVMKDNPSYFVGDKLPAESISWDCAMKQFMPKLGEQFSLPTEAQWEYASRGGVMAMYFFGNNRDLLGEHIWYYSNADRKTHPVGLKKANAFGLYDTHGNVWEWCFDRYKDYSKSEVRDPKISDGSGRIIRGGSWREYGIKYLHSAHRTYAGSCNASFCLGLRLVVSEPG